MGVGRLAAAGLACALVSACAGRGPAPGASGALPLCDDVPKIEAAAELYRDSPIYVANEMPVDDVRAWAATKPGFEEIWIDRDHLGWLTVAFSTDAAERQTELAAAFPGAGVVAVAVPWTMLELETLKGRVVDAMRGGQVPAVSVGINPMHGVVQIGVAVLTDEAVRRVNSLYGGSRACIEGAAPADAPAEGPQQTAGSAWRLLADEDEVGGPYRTGIATDADSLARLWQTVGLSTPLPTVDFQAEVVIWFGAVHGSSCPRLRLDDVRYDSGRGVLYSQITAFNLGTCTADAIGHAYVVAVQRSMLPAGPFRIQLQADDPPSGVLDTEPTIVDADLSKPGATLTDDQVLSPTPTPFVDPYRVEPGDYLEEGRSVKYRLATACGIEWLGQFDGYAWRTEAKNDAPFVPSEWQAVADPDGTVDLWITLSVEPRAHIDATAANVTVTYVPTVEPLPACP